MGIGVDVKAISVAEVDCGRFVHTEMREDGSFDTIDNLCVRYGIKRYPTVITFSGEGAHVAGRRGGTTARRNRGRAVKALGEFRFDCSV